MKILTIPNLKLRQKSKKIATAEITTAKLQRFISDLTDVMKANDGLGIAAPQVGELIRLIIVSTDKGPTAFINPVILWKSLSQEIGEEGCLSVPGVYGLVKRSKSVLVSYFNATGEKKRLKAKGLFARVLQHETDHLNGVLFIDKLAKQKKK